MSIEQNELVSRIVDQWCGGDYTGAAQAAYYDTRACIAPLVVLDLCRLGLWKDAERFCALVEAEQRRQLDLWASMSREHAELGWLKEQAV